MKTGSLQPGKDGGGHAAIVELTDTWRTGQSDEAALDEARALLARARAFAEPLLTGQRFDTGEPALEHADGVSAILQGIGASPALRAAAYLVYASEYLAQPEEVIERAFGEASARLVAHTRALVQVQRNARDAWQDQVDGPLPAEQVERIRKMLLAFSRDLRVVLSPTAHREAETAKAHRG